MTEEKKNELVHDEELYYIANIDETSSLWNQLRVAWRDFHIAKKKEKKSESEIARFEMIILELINALKISDEKKSENEQQSQLKNIFNLTVDKIPDFEKFSYGDKTTNE